MTQFPQQAIEDRTKAVVHYAHRLILSGESSSIKDDALPGLLAELATAYDAQGAGIVAPLDGPNLFKRQSWLTGREPTDLRYPWESDASLFNQAKQALATVVVTDNVDSRTAGASWLFTEITQSSYANFVIWVMDDAGRVWSPGERAALPIAGQALTRLMHQGAAPWTRSLEKAKVQKAVEQAVRVARRLAHDFGNYLTGILGFTELTAKQIPEGSLPQRYLKEVWQSAKDGASWVHKLQSLGQAKIPHFEPTDLAELVQEEENRVKPLWGNAVRVVTNVEAKMTRLDVAREPLRQVLAHLLDNGREAIEGEGLVTLAARTSHLTPAECQGLLGCPKPGAYAEIAITDTGVGLPVELHERLFADFFFSTKPRHRGLGLVTVFWIVQLYHGGVRFGPHPNHGTTVHVFLPLTQDCIRTPPPSPRQRTGELP
jgi:signal transduction histidine kinase